MKPLSIGMFSYSTRPRGSVVHAACLAEALSAQGHEVTLYALDKDGQGFYRPLRCRFVALPARGAPADMEQLVSQRIAEVTQFMTTQRPRHDIVHAQDCLVASGLLAARAPGQQAPVCRTVHHVERFESSYLERCQARSIREAALCLSVSRATQADVLASYGRRTSLVANGVDHERFQGVSDAQAQALRARFGIAAEAPLVVSVGGVEARKNTLGMLEAFALVLESQPTLRWLIAGGASIFEHQHYRDQFEARLAAMPTAVQRAIVRTGVLDEADMPRLLRAADLLLHASLQEGFGLCVLEALAAGTRVVVSRGAPFDEYLDETCAELVQPRDIPDVARGLLAALSPAPEKRETGRARARALSWSSSAHRHERAYRGLLQAAETAAESKV